MTILLALLFACSTPPAGDGPRPDATSPEPTGSEASVPVVDDEGQAVPELPRALRTLDPADLPVRADAMTVACPGSGHVEVSMRGHATDAELDLLTTAGEVVSVGLASGQQATEADLWRRFVGAVDCEAADDAAAWVLRARADGAETDCAVHGPMAHEALAGSYDAALGAAGRPGLATGCHHLAE